MASSMLIFLILLFPPQVPFGKPAPASVVFKHVPEGAVLVLAADVASLGQGFNRGLDKFLKTPFIKMAPSLKPMVQALTAARQMMKAETDRFGVDPFKDIRYAMLAMLPGDNAEEQGILVLGGKIPEKAVEALAAMIGAKQQGELWSLEEGMVFARAKDGTVLFGSKAMVEQALAGKHKNQAIQPLLRGFDRRTYLLLAFQPDQKIRNEWKNEDPMARPLLQSIQGISLRATYKNTVIKVLTSDSAFVKVWGGMLEGLGKLSMASWYASDGLLDIFEAYLASLKSPEALPGEMPAEERAVIETLINNRREVARLIGDLVLGKKTTTSMRTNQREKSATLTVSGLSMAPLILAGMGWLMVGVSAESVQPVIPPQPPAQPLKQN